MPKKVIAMLTVRLDKQLEVAIVRLAKAAGRTKSSVVREALVRHIENIDDVMLSAQARRAGGRAKSIDEVRKTFGLS